jgi:hypothetical protein
MTEMFLIISLLTFALWHVSRFNRNMTLYFIILENLIKRSIYKNIPILSAGFRENLPFETIDFLRLTFYVVYLKAHNKIIYHPKFQNFWTNPHMGSLTVRDNRIGTFSKSSFKDFLSLFYLKPSHFLNF